jgi:HSP20 family protein
MWDEDEGREPVKGGGIGGPLALRSLIEDALFGERRPLFDVKTRSLRPLFKIEATEEAVTVTLDLPRVEKKDISLTSTADTLGVEAKMRRPITLRVGGVIQKRVMFERYTGHFTLPSRVDPEKAKATFRNGLLRVKFPTVRRGNKVKIG